jgi:hypothetical protein
MFAGTLTRARTFVALTRNAKLRPLSREDARLYLHAALAVYVAAWEGYVERLSVNFFTEINDPQIPKFIALHSVVQELASTAGDKFHTPNWENTRNFLVQHTGYDPINDWIWRQRSFGGPQVRERLNEILRIRHSFAHGFPMPSFSWNTSNTGQARLTAGIIEDIESFFINLVRQTDNGMSRHIRGIFNPNVTW